MYIKGGTYQRACSEFICHKRKNMFLILTWVGDARTFGVWTTFGV